MLQMQELDNIIQMLKNIINNGDNINIEIVKEVETITQELNKVLYHSKKLKFQKEYDFKENVDLYINELKKLIMVYEQTLFHRKQKKTDAVFWEIYESFLYVDEKEILRLVIEKFMNLPENIKEGFKLLPIRYEFLQGTIHYDKSDFSLIEQYVKMMTEHLEDYKWLYEHLQDYRSKMILNGIITYWFTFDIDQLHNLCETVFPDYYDMDLLKCDANEVLVDLGAFDGDSVFHFIDTYGDYKKIYAYEITPDTYKELQQNLSVYPDIICKQKGVGKQGGKMYVSSAAKSAANKLEENGSVQVDVVSLDEDIQEDITIIKMDIEGAEKDALLGAKKHIQNEKPRLLISSYHLPADIFEIPKLIHSMREDYKFYMRFNGHDGIWPCDYVLFAI